MENGHKIGQTVGKKLMKLVVRIADVVELAKRFEESPTKAMREVVEQAGQAIRQTLEKVMEAEITLFMGQPTERENKRNGYVTRSYGIKGVGTVLLRVPRDRKGHFASNVVPASRRYDAATEKDMALLNLAGLSTRMLAQISLDVLGVRVSAQEVSNSMLGAAHDGGSRANACGAGNRRNWPEKRAFHDPGRQGQPPRMGGCICRSQGPRPGSGRRATGHHGWSAWSR